MDRQSPLHMGHIVGRAPEPQRSRLVLQRADAHQQGMAASATGGAGHERLQRQCRSTCL